ncbi:MAG: YifB family Mg chelatase-like AAA ATPase [Candidatus Sumerlaeia bacterium]
MPGSFAKVLSFGVYGIDAYLVTIEIDVSISQGEDKPIFQIVGLPEGAVKESRERVRAAIGNAGYWFPGGRVTANLAPADIRKEGAAFDLALAMGVLAASGSVAGDRLAEYAMVGEMGLNGEIRPIRGALPLALGARTAGLKGLLVPADNATEAAVVEGIAIHPVSTLPEAVQFLAGEIEIPPHVAPPFCETGYGSHDGFYPDMADVRGQGSAKRAMEVAAAGGHNLIMVGPPGSGKTMLARRLPGILPPMTFAESLEATKIYSIAGLTGRKGLVSARPFRSPHHTISHIALVGGGAIPRPGEVSLACHGVLFLDEMPEFPRMALETLRQPLEDGHVTVARAAMTCAFPAHFMLCGSMNPCPCGYMTDPTRECRCSPIDIQRYHARLSGPLLDRIDIHIEVPAVKYQELTRGQPGESSAAVRERVLAARRRQLDRFAGRPGVYCNAHMSGKDIERHCKLNDATMDLLERAMRQRGLSARAFHRILKVGRTIADLAGCDAIGPTEISEAIQYRSLDRGL